MTQKALVTTDVTELLFMRKNVEQTKRNIDQISCNLLAQKQLLRQEVEEYSAKRIELLKLELHSRGMTLCTYCHKVILKYEAEFMLFEGAEERSGGHENSCWACHQFSDIHQVCSDCREKAQDRHGTQGRYDSFNKIQAVFYAFSVEKREDGYYARKFESWVKLENDKHKLSEPQVGEVEKLAKEWELPPKIEIDFSSWPMTEEKLIIHE